MASKKPPKGHPTYVFVDSTFAPKGTNRISINFTNTSANVDALDGFFPFFDSALQAKKPGFILIDRYQLVTPTGWNASPRDDAGKLGAMEQSLIGTPVKDFLNPMELLRVVHSFDPCVACSVHLLRPGDRARRHAVQVSTAVL